jgi:hypothetical protein
LAHQYTSIFFWAQKIVGTKIQEADPKKRGQFDGFRPRDWVLRIVSLLNFGLIILDLIQAYNASSSTFLTSALVRLIILPLLSVFHPGVGFFFRRKCKDTLLKVTNIVCAILAWIVFVVLIGLIIYFKEFNTILQLQTLHPPTNFSVPYTPRTASNVVCSIHYQSISVWEMIGFALAPYEILRDPVLFDYQMQYFFGQEWNSRFSFKYRIFNEMPIIIYEDSLSNVTVIGMRGSAAGPELALQLELFVWAYIFPMLTNIAPLYETLTRSLVPKFSSAAQHFGNVFFDVRSVQSLDSLLIQFLNI